MLSELFSQTLALRLFLRFRHGDDLGHIGVRRGTGRLGILMSMPLLTVSGLERRHDVIATATATEIGLMKRQKSAAA